MEIPTDAYHMTGMLQSGRRKLACWPSETRGPKDLVDYHWAPRKDIGAVDAGQCCEQQALRSDDRLRTCGA